MDHQHARQTFEKLSRLVGKLRSKPVPENVHQFRTNSRRVQAILEETGPKPGRRERKLLKSLTRLRKKAGRVRDLDVQIVALKNLKIGEAAEDKRQLLAELNAAREHRAQQLMDSLDRETATDVRKRLKDAISGTRSTRTRGDALAKALRMFNQIAKEVVPNEKTLHAYRIRCKRIRYIAELAGETAEAQEVVSDLKCLQDAIGEWHDWVTLTENAETMFRERPNSALLNAIRTLTRSKLRESLHITATSREKLLAAAQRYRRPQTRGEPQEDVTIPERKTVQSSRPQQSAVTA
jgi:CHAD domain-containing protein